MIRRAYRSTKPIAPAGQVLTHRPHPRHRSVLKAIVLSSGSLENAANWQRSMQVPHPTQVSASKVATYAEVTTPVLYVCAVNSPSTSQQHVEHKQTEVIWWSLLRNAKWASPAEWGNASQKDWRLKSRVCS